MSILTIAEAAKQIAARKLSPVELAKAQLERIRRLDPQLHAFLLVTEERALADAKAAEARQMSGSLRGPLDGIPIAHKDIYCTAGIRTTAHSRLLETNIPAEDAHTVKKWAEAGVVLLGKLATHEFAFGGPSFDLPWPPARNPWNIEHSTGGSSGGSAAAVAAGLVPAAHGNDMGGSIRIPASECGLVGLKPSRGRTSLAPDHGEYWGPLTHEHVLCRSVRDTAAILDATAGAVPGDLYTAPTPLRPWAAEIGADPGRLRIALLQGAPFGRPVHEACSAAALSAARLLESMGHVIEPVDVDVLGDIDAMMSFGAVVSAGVARDLDEWETRLGEPVVDLEPMSEEQLARGRAMSAADLMNAVSTLASWSRRIMAAYAGYDLLLSPTLPVLPPKLGELSPARPTAEIGSSLGAVACLALPFDVTGQPAISLPLSMSTDGLPVGVQLVGGYGREDLLLRVSSALEEASPWEGRIPPVSAAH